MNILIIVCIFNFHFINFAVGDKILAIFPNSLVSHFYAFEPYLIQLANNGHEILVVSNFPQKQEIQNYTDIDLHFIGKEMIRPLSIGDNKHLLFDSANEIMDILCDGLEKIDMLVLQKTLDSLKNYSKFDLIIIELFNTDMFLGLANKYQAPIIAVSSGLLLPWATNRFAVPDNPSFIPVFISTSFDQMTFQQRLTNTITYLAFKILYSYKYIINSERRARKYFGEDMPPLVDLAKQTSLVLVNTHFSISVRRPYPPQVIEVGGMHIKPAKPLPQDIEKFINESEHGVIYFSFGSLVQSSTMKETTVKIFCDVFSELSANILWKWEKTEMPGKPNNVKLVQWAPQRDILAHPNVKVFISHGGLLGVIEAVHGGVPILGIPFFADQMQNIENLVQSGAAIRLDFLNITKESLSYAVKSLLENKKYKENMNHISEIFKDRPRPPLETAVYWTEYVLRHKGAHHLKTAAVDLPWYQYYLLDVIVVLVGSSIFVGFVLFYTVKAVIRRIFLPKGKHKTS